MDNWPEFIYGNMSIKEYVRLVRDSERDIKEEIALLTLRIRDIAKYPYDDPEETFKVTSKMCEAICSLLELI
jgi:hypothetical protein